MVDVEKLCRKKNLLVSGILSAKRDNEETLRRSTEISEDDKSKLKSRIQFIEEKTKIVVDLYEKIVDNQDDDNVAADIHAKGCEFEIEIYKHLDVVKGRLKNITTEKSASKRENVRLPKIELRKFNGDPTEWQNFYNSFVHAVHEQSSLSDVEKMNYLFNLLEGEALSMVKGFQLSNENYGKALNLLKERFGDKQLLISSLMNKMINLEPLTSMCTVKELRNLYDCI